MRLILALIALLTASPAMAQSPALDVAMLPDPAVMAPTSAVPNSVLITGAIEDFARPRFHQFALDAAALAGSVETLCATPSTETLQGARNAFATAALTFSHVELVRIGPLGMGDRLERLLFWPDPKGIALRQVQRALGSKDPSATDPARLEQKSVAMQGLVALEYLLHGTGAEALATGDAYRCDYAKAITVLVGGLATTIDEEWAATGPGSAADQMLDPQPDADYYRSETEVMDKLAATLLHGTDTIRDQRITPILAPAGGGPKPKAALFWRSDLTIPAITANFAGLADFFQAAKFPEAMGRANRWISDGAKFEFDIAGETASALDPSIAKVVADPEQLKALPHLIIVTKSLDTLLGDNLPPVLGLSVGFSALDKD
jgi:predicted lipoprotein